MTGGKAVACAACGQKLRVGWRRCPVCHAAVGPSTSAGSTPRSFRRPSLRAGLAVAFLIGALVAVGVPSVWSVSAPLSSDRPPQSRAVANPRVPPAAATSSETATAAYQARDDRRAGDAAYRRGEFAEAAGRYQASAAAAPDDAQARNNLAQVLVRQNRPADALVELDAAIERDPDQWSYRFNRARVYGLLERWTDAVAEYRVAARLFPEDYATYYNLGLALLKMQQFADAVTALERAVTLEPAQHDFLITLGTAYMGAGLANEARAAFERFLEAAPAAPDAARVRALLASMKSGN